MIRTYALYDILDLYGITTKLQKEALENLMRQAAIISPNQSWQDKFPIRQFYPELVKDILEFVLLIQTHFTIRTGYQERWEIKPAAWMLKNQEANFSYLRTLGFIDSVKPTTTSTDAICILGTTLERITNRLNYANLAVTDGIQADKLILLAGERVATLGVDGTKEQLTNIANNYHISDLIKLTETHLIQEAYNNSLLSNNKIPSYVIDTPAGDLPRPTTQTTILELIEWPKQHEDINDILFVSNQPYVKYQEAIIKEVLQSRNISINVEVIGSGIEFSNADLQPCIEALGSYIWAQTPIILFKLDKKIDDPQLLPAFVELYKKQPLFYQNLSSIFH